MKIENKSVISRRNGDFREFVATLGKLKIGQSFTHPVITGNHRLAISVTQTLLGVIFATSKEDDGYRIGRVA